ncbi:hypothetical protein EAO75_36355 [Streptomyces sp. uw30]|uniref:hypothetical protein n=1 Tax=Streptomyces sp. uw30 TaxID=1828179 RepID=UPI0011CEAF2C|nr:hypothetical protein [Streptomyces sp. uw30]TXS40438.1 hypothetical protein EAO75_36355 [Streptomyces sp. uw30]
MPSPTTRHLTTSALCAALFLGTAAPALAAPPDSGRADTRAASRAAVPARPALQDQAHVLAGLGTVLTPVTRLLDSALDDDDPLTAAEAKELTEAAKEAVAQARKEVEQARKEAEQARKDALAEAKKEVDAAMKEAEELRKEALAEAEAATEEAVEAEPETAGTTPASTLPANLTEDALGALGKTLDALLGVLTSGLSQDVDTSADNVLQALVNVSVATLKEAGLPAAELSGLPTG